MNEKFLIPFFILAIFAYHFCSADDSTQPSFVKGTTSKPTDNSKHLIDIEKLFAEPLFAKLLEKRIQLIVKQEIQSMNQNCSCKESIRGPPGPRGPKGDRGPIGLGLHAPRVMETSLFKEINVSDSTNMTCQFFGNPIPNVSWKFSFHNALIKTKNNNITSEVISTLFIRNITWEDRGDVKCMASTILGKAEASGKLIVHSKPSIHSMPMTVYTNIGLPFTFPLCKAAAYPMANISWERVLLSLGNIKAINTNGTLILKSVSDFDEGFYQCTAINYLGKDIKTIQLKTKPLSFIQDSKDFPALPPDGEVTLWCAAIGNGNKMSGEWYKGVENTKLQSTKIRKASSFNITINANDTGLYRCDIHQVEHTISKNVLVREFSFDSSFLTRDNKNQLYKWIGEIKGFPVQEFKQCWYIKGSENFWDDVDTYEKICNTSENIIQLVLDTERNVFGGYKDSKGEKDFLFDFHKQKYYSLRSTTDQKCKKYGHSFGPCFGKDFYTQPTNCYGSSCNSKYSYAWRLGNRFNAGSTGSRHYITSPMLSFEILQGV